MKSFNVNCLAENLTTIAEIDFAYLFGSSQNGMINNNSDVDVAVYLNRAADLSLISKINKIVEDASHGECDLAILNNSSAILAMEAIKGRQLFFRNEKQEEYVEFSVRTCREYEDQIYEMEKNLEYRGFKC